MSAIVDAMDVLLSIRSKDSKLSAHTRQQAWTNMALLGFFLLTVLVKYKYANGGRHFSVVLTLGSMLQCLAFLLLSMKVMYQKSVAGLSLRTMEMYVAMLLFRLSSTFFKDGYLPADKSGDYVYQCSDCLSLVLVLRLLYVGRTRYADTYQSEQDALQAHRALPVCVVLGVLLRGDLNDSLFFDSMWMISTLIDTISLLPQLFMLTKLGGKVECFTSHFIASTVAGRVCCFLFWLHGYKEIGRVSGSRLGSYTVLLMLSAHLLLCADFMYYYIKGLRSQGGVVVLPCYDI